MRQLLNQASRPVGSSVAAQVSEARVFTVAGTYWIEVNALNYGLESAINLSTYSPPETQTLRKEAQSTGNDERYSSNAIDTRPLPFSYSRRSFFERVRPRQSAHIAQLLEPHGDLHKGSTDNAEHPDQHRRNGDRVWRESIATRGAEPERDDRRDQRNADNGYRGGQLHGHSIRLRRHNDGGADHYGE